MPASRIYNPFVGSSGGGGGGGVTPAQVANAEEIQTKRFSFLDNSVLIFNIPANAKIISTQVGIEIPFDDAINTAIIVGDSGNLSRLLPLTKIDPSEAGVYSSHVAYEYVAATSVYLTISVNASVQGSGYVTVIYNLNN